MTRSHVLRLGATIALASATLAACSGTTSSSAAPAVTTAPSVEAPSTSTESPSASMEASASPAASEAASSEPSGSPEARVVQIQAGDNRCMHPPVDPTTGTVLTFRNVGQQAHELVVVRRND